MDVCYENETKFLQTLSVVKLCGATDYYNYITSTLPTRPARSSSMTDNNLQYFDLPFKDRRMISLDCDLLFGGLDVSK